MKKGIKTAAGSLLAAGLMLGCLVPAAASEETEVTVPEIEITETFEIPDNDAMAFLRQMGAGWNLGNTFDAFQDRGITKSNEMKLESSWCGVVTDEEVVKTLSEEGFSTLRVPVSWHNHVSGENFEISEKWLDRVQEVVDYGIDNGLYVILNSHHDIYPEYCYPSSRYLENSERYIESIWTQLSERFADYGDHLIFESMNEPRLKETDNEWWWDDGSDACLDSMECINRLNQLFVDTVRASGGNNEDRYLMVPSYDASPEYAVKDAFVLPADTADNRIIVSAHAYTPYSFALDLSGTDSFSLDSAQQTGDINYFMDGLYKKYISEGIPVVIGEYGALAKGKNNLQDRVDFTAYYVANASARNIPCCWWDNGAFSGNGELFGILQRDSHTWKYPEIMQAITDNRLKP